MTDRPPHAPGGAHRRPSRWPWPGVAVLAAALLASAATVVGVLAVVPGTMGSASPPPQALQVGTTHGQTGPDPWHPAEATDRALEILRSTTDAGNQHIMGFGALNPAPTPDSRDWASLDSRMALIEATGTTPVITLCCAPDWMKGGRAGETDWSQIEVAPEPEFYDDFAALAAEVAQRYPQVRTFVVWNELKGFADADENDWDIAAYTDLYNAVYRALKDVDPEIRVGGPYVPMDSWSSAGRASHPSALTGEWGVVDQRALDAVDHWLANADGADFLAVDGSSATNDAGLVAAPEVANEKFAVIVRWLRERSALPIWWMELYAEVDESEPWNSELRADATLDAVLRIGDAGGDAVFLWQPEGSDDFASVGLWDSTEQADGGRAQPIVERLAWIRDTWAEGRSVRYGWSGGRLQMEAPDS